MKRRRSRRIRHHSMRRKRSTMRGGLLVTNPETHLINTHICGLKPGVVKDSPGEELLNSISNPFPLTRETIGYAKNMYQSTENMWFKFVAFNNDGENHVFLMDGAKVNKHSVCMLIGLLTVTREKGEYAELREAVKQLLFFRNQHGPISTPETQEERTRLVNTVNHLIERDVQCLPVIAAGSGSILADGRVCINNKSGHYKPTDQSMAIAQDIFEANTGLSQITVKSKEDKDALKARFGDDYESYTGICL